MEKTILHDRAVSQYKNIICLTLSCLLSWPVLAQPYYINSLEGLEIITISGTSCSSQFIVDFFEISTVTITSPGAFHFNTGGSMFTPPQIKNA